MMPDHSAPADAPSGVEVSEPPATASFATAPHAVAPDVALAAVRSRTAGLTGQEARGRRAPLGDQRPRRRGAAFVGELVESLTEPLQLLLIAVGVLSAIFGEVGDAIAIFVIIGLVASVEALSEARAHNALNALRTMTAPIARVRRDGSVVTVPAAEVAVGDVVVVEAGDVLTGDSRVFEAAGLASDESALTGEPVSAAKGAQAVEADAALAERSSMLFAGTAIVAGTGSAVVVAIGDDTELGRLGKLTAEAKEPPTPLQRATSELARATLVVAVAASVIVPLIGILRGQPAEEALLTGLTLAFATIPEELPILVTALVAVGGLRLARSNVLLRRTRAAEAVGGVTVVLTDKTGTLTENRLRLERAWATAHACSPRPGPRTAPTSPATRWTSRSPPRATDKPPPPEPRWSAFRSTPSASAKARPGGTETRCRSPSRAPPSRSSAPAG